MGKDRAISQEALIYRSVAREEREKRKKVVVVRRRRERVGIVVVKTSKAAAIPTYNNFLKPNIRTAAICEDEHVWHSRVCPPPRERPSDHLERGAPGVHSQSPASCCKELDAGANGD